MKRVLIRIGFEDDFQPLMIANETVSDFETAIFIVKASGFKNVFLKQITSSGSEEWDNL
jgi:hypothetical protein